MSYPNLDRRHDYELLQHHLHFLPLKNQTLLKLLQFLGLHQVILLQTKNYIKKNNQSTESANNLINVVTSSYPYISLVKYQDF